MRFLLFTFILAGLLNQGGLNFHPRQLDKDLKKAGCADFQLEEISTSAHHNPLSGKYFRVKGSNSPVAYIYIGRVNSCRAGGCNNPGVDGKTGYNSEYFDYYMLLSSDYEVMKVRVYNYAATHGQEISVKGWLKQFIGYNGEQDLRVGKEIDAISGATVSVYAITADIQHKVQVLKKL